MADQIYKGYHEALRAGDLDGSPDVRYGLFMGSFAFDADSVNLADGTLDEFDGAGYARADAGSVTVAYVDAEDETRMGSADVQFGAGDVAPGSGVIAGLFAYLYVDGTAANDVILFSTTDGGFGINANNGTLTFVLADEGISFIRQAA